jgi:cell division protein FtsW
MSVATALGTCGGADAGSRAADRLVVAVLALAALGQVMAVSVRGPGFAGATADGPVPALLSHGIKLTLGLLALLAASRVPLRHIRSAALPLFLAALLLCLFAVLFGPVRNGARRWLVVAGQSFQPVEALKVAIVLLVAVLCADRAARMDRFRDSLVVVWPIAASLCVLLLQPDLGSGVLVAAVGISMVLVAGGRPAHFLAIGAPFIVLAVWYAAHRLLYPSERWHSFLNPQPGDQVSQSLVALGAGGMSGLGLGEGWMKLGFVPEARNDFVFSIIGEELGLAGTVGVLGLYALFGLSGLQIALARRDRFGAALAFGLTLGIVLQAVINMAVVTGSAPAKGIDLPFVSSGGTNLVLALAAAGVIVNVGRNDRKV